MLLYHAWLMLFCLGELDSRFTKVKTDFKIQKILINYLLKKFSH